jgi:hypothetical protein
VFQSNVQSWLTVTEQVAKIILYGHSFWLLSHNVTYTNVAQFRGTVAVLRTLALLLAAHSRATPKQAKEPISYPTDKYIIYARLFDKTGQTPYERSWTCLDLHWARADDFKKGELC